MMNGYYQQGDVLIIGVSIPKTSKRIEKRALALGEHTGNSHQVVEDDIEMYESDGVVYLKNSSPSTIQHQEHGPITIPAGEWKVGIVQEYDEFEQAARNVRD